MFNWVSEKQNFISEKHKFITNLIKSFKEHQVSKIIGEDILKKLLDYVENNPNFNKTARKYFKDEEYTDPYSNYELEPDEITQIKKIIVALREAKIVFSELEKLPENWDFQSNGWNWFNSESWGRYSHILTRLVPMAYEACQLLTHFDVNLPEIYSKEIAEVLSLLTQFEKLTKANAENTKELAESIKNYPISRKIGKITGATINQLKAKEQSSIDLEFLNHFTKEIPGYLDKLNAYIKKYSTDIISNEQNTNKEQFIEIQKTTDELFDGLKNLKGNDLQLAYRALLNIYKIRHIVTLSQTTIEGMKSVSNSSQDVIREHLAELKYKILPNLFSLLDKIEVHCLLKPGSLSNPVMTKVRELYKTVIELAQKPVDFSTKGKELLEIEDIKFYEIRNEQTYHRIDEANKKKTTIEAIFDAFDTIAMFIFESGTSDLTLYSLPRTIKEQIKQQYRLIQPHLIKVDPILDKKIMNELEQQGEPSWYQTFTAWNEDYVDATFLKVREKIFPSLQKQINTYAFQIELNNQILKNQKDVALQLSSSFNKKSPLRLDEEVPFRHHIMPLQKLKTIKNGDGHGAFGEPHSLTYEQADKIAFRALEKCNKILRQACHENPQIQLKDLSEEWKKALLKEYSLLKPYLELADLPEPLKKKLSKEHSLLRPYLEFKNPIAYTLILEHLTTHEQKISVVKPTEIGSYNEEMHSIRDEFRKIQRNYEIQDQAFAKFINMLTACEKYDSAGLVKELPDSDLEQLSSQYKKIQYIIASIKPEIHRYLISYFSIDTPSSILHALKRIKTQFEIQDQDFNTFITLLESFTNKYSNHWWKDSSIEKNRLYQGMAYDLKHMSKTYMKIKSIVSQVNADVHFSLLECLPGAEDNTVLKQLASFSQKDEKTNDNVIDILTAQQNLKESITAISQELPFKNNSTFDRVVETPDDLSSEHALTLSQWYDHLHNKFSDVYKSYFNFFKVLHLQEYEGVIKIESVSEEQKDKLKKYYIQFQDYFISAVAESEQFNAQELDKALVTWLNGESSFIQEIPVYLIQNIQEPLIEHSKKLTERRALYRNQFKNKLIEEASSKSKLIEEQQSTHLKPELGLDDRSTFVFKTKNASGLIHDLRSTIQLLTVFFDVPIKKQLLKAEKDDLPYPELIDENRTLEQSHTTRSAKHILNSLYLVENFFSKLEQLDNSSLQVFYITHVGEAFDALRRLHININGIKNDPYLEHILRDILKQVQGLWVKLQDQTEEYKTDPSEIKSSNPVENHGLWYALNAFYISPQHIRKFSEHDYMTQEDLSLAQSNAKQTAANIEKIIKESNSYAKIFINVPTVYNLFQELRNNLHEFCSTSYDGVIHNINKIQSEFIYPIIYEADTWELKLGLAPGTISEPISNVLHEYFGGFLGYLNLKSHQLLTTLCDRRTTDKRILDTLQELAILEENMKACVEHHKAIDDLYKAMHPTAIENEPKLDIELTKTLYKKALPHLSRLQDDVTLPPKLELKEEPADFELLKTYVTSCHHYYLGLQATYKLETELVQNKIEYLNNLVEKQENQRLITYRTYAETAFDKQLKISCNRQVGLVHYPQEYQQELTQYLENMRDKIINVAKNAKDIDKSINDQFVINIKRFEEDRYPKYYHLESIKIAIVLFYIYINKQRGYIAPPNSNLETLTTIESKETYNTSYSETLTTIESKEDALNKLNIISNDKSKTIDQRIIEINDEMASRTFRTNMFQDPDFGNNYLKTFVQYLLEFLKAISIYKPKQQTLFDSLQGALKEGKRYDKDLYFGSIENAITNISTYIEEQEKYLDNSYSYSEDIATIEEKKRIIKEINKVAQDSELTMDKRIKKVKKIIESEEFCDIMFDEPEFHDDSWSTFVQHLLHLLEALYLYTPQSKNLFYKLEKAVKNEAKISDLAIKYSLFSADTTKYAQSEEEEDFVLVDSNLKNG